MNKKKIIISVVTIILAIIGIFVGINYTDEDINKIADGVETVVNIIEDNKSTTEIPNLTKEDEQVLEVQEADLEKQGFERQGEIAYNGSDKAPNVKLGEYAGLTYYSQIDSRWKNKMYSAINDKSQTIGLSGCGPTCSAMVVSSIKGNITPSEMADLYVKYGYRSRNNGTYWSAMKWTADVFDIEYKETRSFDTAMEMLNDNNYIIAICNEGLFTYGGHFIVLIGTDGDSIKIYDPYLYAGKFDVASRRGKATVKGNTVYVSKSNFKKYANARMYYCFKNENREVKDNNTTVVVKKDETTNVKSVNYKVKVTAQSGLNIRTGASTNYKCVGGYTRGSAVTITKESNGWGKTDKGWICLKYTSKINEPSYKTMKVTAKIGLNIRSGRGTNYKIKGAYQYNAKIKVTDIKNGWSKTNKGYVCIKYLK